MKKLFYKEVPLVEPHHDKAIDTTPKIKKLAYKANKFVNKHPFAATAIVIGATHVACYGALAYVTNLDSDGAANSRNDDSTSNSENATSTNLD